MERWLYLVDIANHICRTGEIPQGLGLTVLVLIPKTTTDTRGIGIIETLWKVVESLIETGLSASLQLHGVFHGFRDGIGTGTDIIELNLAQEISSIDQGTLFLVFLYLRKAYDTMDGERLLITLEVYIEGPHMFRLLETLWGRQQVLPI